MRRQKLLCVLFMILGAVAFAGSSVASTIDTLVVDIDVVGQPLTDENEAYWTGSDWNSVRGSWVENAQLNNSNETTEEAWLKALLGQSYNAPSWLVKRDEDSFKATDLKSLAQFDPGFAWTYAVVKYDGKWVAYWDENDDNKLTTDTFKFGVSHVTFFTPVPLPGTALLLAPALVVFSAVRRRRRQGKAEGEKMRS